MRVRDIDWSSWQATDPATLVFVVKGSSILLIRKKRGLGAGKINAPGGRLEPGETPLEAAIRETREEVCITPLRLSYAGVNRFQFLDGYSIHVHVFKALDYEGEPAETGEATPLWTPVDRIPYEEMWEDDRLWVPMVLEGVPFSGRYIFDGEVMLDHEIEQLREET
ncbi:MAG TPA: 8-oxo-dGTP diphosphatase [Vicinamibacteria bacterium]|nr:8-oxo-dGTP diphosphatase [Vicinamibacteria bacterium]